MENVVIISGISKGLGFNIAKSLLSSGWKVSGFSRKKSNGIKDLEKKYNLNDLAHGDIIFSATGVTEGTMVRGVRSDSSHFITHSLVLRTGEASSQYIETYHKKD